MADSVAKVGGVTALIFRRCFLSVYQFCGTDWLLVLPAGTSAHSQSVFAPARAKFVGNCRSCEVPRAYTKLIRTSLRVRWMHGAFCLSFHLALNVNSREDQMGRLSPSWPLVGLVVGLATAGIVRHGLAETHGVAGFKPPAA
jgi:hypothetical protein